jgi:starch synthase
MNILFVTSELAPFAKTGGLADVSAALPRHLSRRGHDVRVFLPFYPRVAGAGRTFKVVEAVRDVEVALGAHTYQFSLLSSPLPGSDLEVYFVHCPALYQRPSIYTADPDEHIRFLLLGRAALESAQRMGFAPDILHCNDWQSGLLPLTLKVRYSWDRLFARTKTVLTIHNLNYQGIFRSDILNDTGLADARNLFHQDQLHDGSGGRINFLLHGILYADGITTVSPTYAREIQTPEHGAGLDGLLRARSSTVVGILNGVDYDEWSPESDRHIPFRYSAHDLAPKLGNKEALLGGMGLRHVAGVPTVGIVSRLAAQKGFELLAEAAPPILAKHDVRLVVLGSGEGRLEEMFTGLQRAFPSKVSFYNGYNNDLAHLVEAGADLFLMPSRYEPCGLNQMYSLRYGTVPLVRKTGGLADSVDETNGFLFERYAGNALRATWELALRGYRQPAFWRRLVLNGMGKNYSWDTQGRLYEEVYARLHT